MKPGGRVVYSTCSNEPEENAEQVAAFLAAHPDFTEVDRRESVPFETNHDGAFACALVRSGDCTANVAFATGSLGDSEMGRKIQETPNLKNSRTPTSESNS